MNKTFMMTEFELTEIRFEFHFGSLDINEQMNASDSILADVSINLKYIVESFSPKSQVIKLTANDKLVGKMQFDICNFIVRKQQDHMKHNTNIGRIKTLTEIKPIQIKDVNQIKKNKSPL